MTRGVRSQRWITRILLIAGGVLVMIGVGDAIRIRPTHPEKPAYYFPGHWFEALWQLQVPLIARGIAAFVVAWMIEPRR